MRLAIGAALLSLLCANAFAATAECPSAADITQEKLPQGGYSYKADGPDGHKWVGENPEGQESDLATFVFTAAAYRAKSSQGNTDVVSCDFEGTAQDAFARMTLYSFRDWAPVSKKDDNGNETSKWQQQSPPPNTVYSCNSKQQGECAFEYSKLER